MAAADICPVHQAPKLLPDGSGMKPSPLAGQCMHCQHCNEPIKKADGSTHKLGDRSCPRFCGEECRECDAKAYDRARMKRLRSNPLISAKERKADAKRKREARAAEKLKKSLLPEVAK